MFNMILCDLRDRAGDEACGIRSLPVVLGDKGTRWLLVALLAGIEALALGAWALSTDAHRGVWAIMCILGPLYLGGMLIAAASVLKQNPRPTTADIKNGMNGHLCRCGTHYRIVRAIERAAREGARP